MRWFKHFSDNHRGRTVRELMSRFGHQGPCCYYFLMEMCAEKLEASDLSANQEFVFEMKLVRQMLGVSQTKLEQILNVCQTFVQLSFRIDGTNSAKFLKIKMPILLELLDRDLKKPRSKRATNAKKARLDIDIDKDKDKDNTLDQKTFDRVSAFEALYKNYPRKVGKEKGFKIFKNQVKTKKDLEALGQAINRYVEFCKKEFVEDRYIKHFSTFMASWRDWLDPDVGVSKSFVPKEEDQFAFLKKEKSRGL